MMHAVSIGVGADIFLVLRRHLGFKVQLSNDVHIMTGQHA
jgi:hypothetical protein